MSVLQASRNVCTSVVNVASFNVHIFIVGSNRHSIMSAFYLNSHVAVTAYLQMQKCTKSRTVFVNLGVRDSGGFCFVERCYFLSLGFADLLLSLSLRYSVLVIKCSIDVIRFLRYTV
jgi:hypothetical protein